MKHEYVTPAEAAALMRLSQEYLAKLRVSGAGPAFYKLNSRTILYCAAEIENWLQSRRRMSTSAQPSQVSTLTTEAMHVD